MKALRILLVLISISSFIYGQKEQWVNFYGPRVSNTLAFEDDFVWIGTDLGLIKLNKKTGTKDLFLTKNSGLPGNHINVIKIDKKGNKWIGTDKGLAMFDNFGWVVYDSSNSGLPRNNISAIAFDKEGIIWIGTGRTPDSKAMGGLVKFDGKSDWKIYSKSNSGLTQNHITSIAIDSAGNKWLGVKDAYDNGDNCGLIKFDGSNWSIYDPYQTTEPPNFIVSSIVIDPDNNVWTGAKSKGTGTGIYKLEGDTWTKYDSANLFPSPTTSLIMDSNKNIVYGDFNNNLITFNIQNPWAYSSQQTDSIMDYTGMITDVQIDSEGNKWVAVTRSLKPSCSTFKYDNKTWTQYSTSNSELPENNILSIAFDQPGNIWFCTASLDLNDEPYENEPYGGLAKFDMHNWTVYNKTNSILPGNNLTSMAIDKNNSIWAAAYSSYGCIVNIFNNKWTLFSDETIQHLIINHMCFDRDSNLWIAAGQSLGKYNGTAWTYIDVRKSGLLRSIVGSFTIDNDNVKWITTGSNNLIRYDDKNWSVLNYTNSGLPDDVLRVAASDKKGNIWIGTGYEDNYGNISGSLVKYNGKDWTIYNQQNSSLPKGMINLIAFDSSGNKWLVVDYGKTSGSSGALVKFDDRNWTVYDTSNTKLLSSKILSIAIDGKGNKWIGTKGVGLSVFREEGVDLTNVEQTDKNTPANFLLAQNFPNPFNPVTTISYSIPIDSYVELKVFDILGREISTLVSKEQSTGEYRIQFDASSLPSGIYIYSLQAGEFTDSRKLLLIK